MAEVLRFRGWEFERKYSLSKLIKDLPLTLKKKSLCRQLEILCSGGEKNLHFKMDKGFFFSVSFVKCFITASTIHKFKRQCKCSQRPSEKIIKSHQTHLFFVFFSLPTAAVGFHFATQLDHLDFESYIFAHPG